MGKPSDEGLSLGYRTRWRMRYVLFSLFGPAQLGTDDPKSQLVAERAARAAAARDRRSASHRRSA